MATNKNLPDRRARFDSVAVGRWLILGGSTIAIVFPIVWTMVGLLRPGYSPIHQAISDLGVGPNGQLVDGLGFLSGLLKLGFAVGLALVLRGMVDSRGRVAEAVLLGLSNATTLLVAIFTDAPRLLPSIPLRL